MKPSQAAMAASAALQSHTGTGSSGASRKALGQLSAHSGNALGGRKAGGGLGTKEKDKENLRTLGMGMESGKSAGKLQVFTDDGIDGAPVKLLETRLRSRRALGDKAKAAMQSQESTISIRDRKPSAVGSSFTVFQDPIHESIGQENIPPLGADPETNPSSAIRRSTRKTISTYSTSRPSAETRTQTASRHDSGIEDPESPFISKPRLRKLKPTLLESSRPVEALRNSMIASSSQPQAASLVLASSQPYSEAPETLDSSPLIARPQTRKATATASTLSGKDRSTRHPVSAFSVQPDPVLCDVSEAYGADTSLQPGDFGRETRQSGSTGKVAVRRDTEGTRSGLRSSVRPKAEVLSGHC